MLLAFSIIQEFDDKNKTWSGQDYWEFKVSGLDIVNIYTNFNNTISGG